MAGVLYRLGRLCANRAIVVVAVWLGLVVLVRLLPRVDIEGSRSHRHPRSRSASPRWGEADLG